jgi:hypothetical protein
MAFSAYIDRHNEDPIRSFADFHILLRFVNLPERAILREPAETEEC